MIENEQVEEIMLVLDDKLSKTVSVLKEDFPSSAQAAPIRTSWTG